MTESTRRQLEAYLDREMSMDDRMAFERLIENDANLKAAIQHQLEINQSLRRLFPVSSAASITTILEQANIQQKSTGSLNKPPSREQFSSGNWLRRLAVAAVLVAGLYGLWSSFLFFFPQAPRFIPAHGSGGASQLRFDEYYTKKVDSGFQPYWQCKDDAEFAETFRTRFGQALAMKPLPAGIACAGLDYGSIISNLTTAVLFNVGDEKVIVLVDATDPPEHCRKKTKPLRTFEKMVGKLRLIEITPFDHPQALDLFFNPDARTN